MTQALVAEGVALVEGAQRDGVTLRLLGGAAVVLHGSGVPYREIGDLDAVTGRKDVKRLTAVLQQRGYDAQTRFNAMHGDRRLIFHGPAGKLDVFVERFEMCHRLELGARLALDSPTIPVTDLLVTKLQVVELNEKDARDLADLLRHHSLGAGDGDHFDAEYLAALVGDDWGLWRTLTGTLDRLPTLAPDVGEQAIALRRVLDDAPKGRRWRMRARVGERKRWYELPDDLE
ncbi:MAG: hypothetical protein V7607_1571 [Solirubrobacteraceae bacterium]